jgi:hypothetical protein
MATLNPIDPHRHGFTAKDFFEGNQELYTFNKAMDFLTTLGWAVPEE